MTDPRCRPLLLVPVLALLLWCCPRPTEAACPFCAAESTPTLIEDFRQAPLVVLGKFVDFKPGTGDLGSGVYELEIEKVLKPHQFVKNKKLLTLERGAPPGKSKFVVFLDVFEGRPDAYRGVEVLPESDLVEYFTKALALKDRPNSERLQHCFNFLTSKDNEVSMDAYREFAKADYKDYKEMAKKLPADKIASWLQDSETPAYRYGLYASLLGHCGEPVAHGKLLRSLCDDPEKQRTAGLDGLMAAYVMLQPKEGWNYVDEILKDARQSFETRYAALRTVRFLWGERTDLVAKDQLVVGVSRMLDDPEMADFAIEDLRKWKRWELNDRILGLFKSKTHDATVIKRAILRYAIQSPQATAKAFVGEQRKRDPEWVADAEELLRLEAEALPPEPEAKKK